MTAGFLCGKLEGNAHYKHVTGLFQKDRRPQIYILIDLPPKESKRRKWFPWSALHKPVAIKTTSRDSTPESPKPRSNLMEKAIEPISNAQEFLLGIIAPDVVNERQAAMKKFLVPESILPLSSPQNPTAILCDVKSDSHRDTNDAIGLGPRHSSHGSSFFSPLSIIYNRNNPFRSPKIKLKSTR